MNLDELAKQYGGAPVSESMEDLAKQFGGVPVQAPPPSTERTFGQAIKDVPASLLTGVGSWFKLRARS
jgi:hypothetical protein